MNIIIPAYVTNNGKINMSQHRMGSHHYNALMFSIIWQYTRYSIKEKLESKPAILSTRYLEYFNRTFV